MVDVLLWLFLAAFTLRGAWAGDSRELRNCLAWLASLGLAAVFHPLLQVPISFCLQPEVRVLLAFAACALLVFPGAYLFLVYVFRRFRHQHEVPVAGRILGALFALLRGGALLVCLSSVLAVLPIESRQLAGSELVPILAVELPGASR